MKTKIHTLIKLIFTTSFLFVIQLNAISQNEQLNNKKGKRSENISFKSKTADMVRLTAYANGNMDSLIVAFNENASQEYDNEYDILSSPPSSGDIPNIYTISPSGNKFFKNTLPSNVMKDHTLSFGLELYTTGSCEIITDEVNGIDSVHIYLLDIDEGRITNLRTDGYYQFDHDAGIDNDRFELIFEQNSPPILFGSVDNQQTNEDEIYEYYPAFDLFIDLDHDDIISYEIKTSTGEELPDWVNYDPVNKKIHGTPLNEDVRILPLRILAYDIFNDSAYCDFNLEVLNINDPPELNINIDDQIILYDAYYEFTVPDNTFIDIDPGDELNYFAFDMPDWLNFNSEDQIFWGTPDSDDLGISTIILQAEDLSGETATENFNLEVSTTLLVSTNLSENIKVGPNPTHNFVKVDFDILKNNHSLNVKIYSTSGKCLKNINLHSEVSYIDLTDLSVGIYIMRFNYNNDYISKYIIKN